jgi:hypothetical protein
MIARTFSDRRKRETSTQNNQGNFRDTATEKIAEVQQVRKKKKKQDSVSQLQKQNFCILSESNTTL